MFKPRYFQYSAALTIIIGLLLFVVSHSYGSSAGGGGGSVTVPIPNASLANSSLTIAGHAVSLGSSQALAIGDLTAIGSNTVAANTGATSAVPAAASLPSCADSTGNHLNYTFGTGFSCGTSSAHAGTVTSVTLTGDGVVLSSTPSGAVTASGTVSATLASAPANSVLNNATGSSAAPSYTGAVVIGTSVTSPLHIGGTAATSTLTLESTSGAGSGDTILFKTGSQITQMVIGTQTVTTALPVAVGTSSAFSSSNELTAYGSAAIGTSYANTAAPTNGLIVQGKVGVGTSTAGSQFTEGSSGQLTMDASGNLVTTGTATVANVNVTANTTPANGMYLGGANQVNFAVGSTGIISISNPSSVRTLTFGGGANEAINFNGATNAALFFSNGANAFLTGSIAGDTGALGVAGKNFLIGITGASVPAIEVTSTSAVAIGTTAVYDSAKFLVNGTLLQTTALNCAAGVTTDALGAFNGCVASDPTLKDDIKPLVYDPGMVDKIKPITYIWKDRSKDRGRIHAGFNARQVQGVYPEAVIPAGTNTFGVDPNALHAAEFLDLQNIHGRLAVLEAKEDISTAHLNWAQKMIRRALGF